MRKHALEEGDFVFVIVRKVCLEKGYRNQEVEKFEAPSPIDGVAGLIRRELLINESKPDMDILSYIVYWQDKHAFYAWERSPVHLALHQAKAKERKPSYIISVQKEAYEQAFEKVYRE